MIVIDGVPHFGSPQNGTDYIPRPSVYALILDMNRQIAVVKHKSAFFLPGGGIEPGETPVEALQREIIEEMGYQTRKVQKRCEAVEYLRGVSDGENYRIHSIFFVAELETEVLTSTEPDHQLVWMKPENAIPKMQRACHKWAIAEFFRDNEWK